MDSLMVFFASGVLSLTSVHSFVGSLSQCITLSFFLFKHVAASTHMCLEKLLLIDRSKILFEEEY